MQNQQQFQEGNNRDVISSLPLFCSRECRLHCAWPRSLAPPMCVLSPSRLRCCLVCALFTCDGSDETGFLVHLVYFLVSFANHTAFMCSICMLHDVASPLRCINFMVDIEQ